MKPALQEMLKGLLKWKRKATNSNIKIMKENFISKDKYAVKVLQKNIQKANKDKRQKGNKITYIQKKNLRNTQN